MRIYVGTYTDKTSRGIYAIDFDQAGQLGEPTLIAATSNPYFLALHPTGKWIYAVNEDREGMLSAFAMPAGAANASPASLSAIGKQPTLGSAPCYVAIDRTGRYAAGRQLFQRQPGRL